MNITLIGMAGVGKSLIGRALAKRLHYKFFDTDKIIEKNTKLRLQTIIDKLGEDKFLEIEEHAILKLDLGDRCILSPGGSVVYSKGAMKFLKKHTTVVFLKASFKNINNWISNKSERGIIGLKKEGLRKLFKERLPLYEKYADAIVRLPQDYNINCVVDSIINKLKI